MLEIKEPEDDILFGRAMTANAVVEVSLLSLIYRMCVQRDAYRTKNGSSALCFFELESVIMEKLLKQNNIE